MQTGHTFTLVEVVVVLAILTVLGFILVPIYGESRQRAMVTACASNQRTLFHAANLFEVDYGRLPVYGSPTTASYLDVLEGQTADGEFGTFLADYAGVDTVPQRVMDPEGGDQLAIRNWQSSPSHCPAAEPPARWWYDRYHHAMAPWETLDYRFVGLHTYAALVTAFPERRLAQARNPARVAMLYDATFSPGAEAIAPLFGKARRNNHGYTGMNLIAADGSGRWIPMSGLRTLDSLGSTAGYYTTSHIVDGTPRWWRPQWYSVPVDYWSSGLNGQVQIPADADRHRSAQLHIWTADVSGSPQERALRYQADALGYTYSGVWQAAE